MERIAKNRVSGAKTVPRCRYYTYSIVRNILQNRKRACIIKLPRYIIERRIIMVYISSFTYCDSIQTEMTPQGSINQIVNPLQVLAPIAVPGNYSFAIACNIVKMF